MGIRVNTNLAALHGWRQLARTEEAFARSLRHLATGERITAAADDAAGLAVATRMAARQRGMLTSSRGVQDAVSMLQVADGSARTISQMLLRMRELAVQAGDGALSTRDRQALQAEVDQLGQEVQATARGSTFNERKLLDTGAPTAARMAADDPVHLDYTNEQPATQATLRSASVQLDGGGTTDFGTVTISGVTTNLGTFTNGIHTTADAAAHIAGRINANALNVVRAEADGDQVVVTANTPGTAGSFTVSASSSALNGFSPGASATGLDYDAGTTDFGSLTINGVSTGIGVLDNNDYDELEAAEFIAARISADHSDLTAVAQAGRIFLTSVATGSGATIAIQAVTENSDGDASNDAPIGFLVGRTNRGSDPEGSYLSSGLAIQLGAMAGDSLTLQAPAATAVDLGVAEGDLDLGTVEEAQTSLAAIDAALEELGTVTSTLGALMNRLTHAIDGLEQRAELLGGARSRIADADMAAEVMTFTRQQILRQSATAMLGQANVQAEGVLPLLTG